MRAADAARTHGMANSGLVKGLDTVKADEGVTVGECVWGCV